MVPGLGGLWCRWNLHGALAGFYSVASGGKLKAVGVHWMGLLVEGPEADKAVSGRTALPSDPLVSTDFGEPWPRVQGAFARRTVGGWAPVRPWEWDGIVWDSFPFLSGCP